MTFAVLATGPSLTVEQVQAVRHLRVIAVSDAYKLAPWAEELVSGDPEWWEHHKPEFAGRKISNRYHPSTRTFKGISTGTNSGVVAIKRAVILGAKEIILLGFDGGSSHFFGEHPDNLKTTSPSRLSVHMRQHRQEAHACAWAGVKVWNCSPNTAIPYYPTARLDECLRLSADANPARSNMSCAA